MVKELINRDSRFIHFNRQDLSKWRDSSIKDRLVWSKKTLAEVQKEFSPGGTTTCFDIFVSIFHQLNVSY